MCFAIFELIVIELNIQLPAQWISHPLPAPHSQQVQLAPAPPRSKFNPHLPRTHSSAGSRNPRGLTRPAQHSNAHICSFGLLHAVVVSLLLYMWSISLHHEFALQNPNEQKCCKKTLSSATLSRYKCCDRRFDFSWINRDKIPQCLRNVSIFFCFSKHDCIKSHIS